MDRPLIMVAPTGARRGKADHPALPVTPPEIVATAVACHAAGADALHLHVRDEDGQHSLDAGRYTEALAELAQAVPGMAIQVTTEAAGRYGVADQLACLQAVRPDWASISVREIAREPALGPRVYAFCRDAGIRVQHILYDRADGALLANWRARGVVPRMDDGVLHVFGRYTPPTPADPAEVQAHLGGRTCPPGAMVCAFGPRELDCLVAAARLGADLRVGFENNLLARDGNRLDDNADAVSRLVQELERIPA